MAADSAENWKGRRGTRHQSHSIRDIGEMVGVAGEGEKKSIDQHFTGRQEQDDPGLVP